jgi:hypothetical protein
MSDRCNLELGNGRFVCVCTWKDDMGVDIRECQQDTTIPTKKGISLPLGRWKNHVHLLSYQASVKRMLVSPLPYRAFKNVCR